MPQHAQTQAHNGKFYTLFVDGVEYHVHQETMTGAEIMALAEIPQESGLILVSEDGTETQVRPNEVIELAPGRRFKKAPRFKRG